MKRVLCVMGSVFIAVCAWGQGRENGVLGAFFENMVQEMETEGNGEGMEELMDFYGRLANNPLDVNRASRGELERLGILSDFQIVSLLDYREKHGDILSATELQLVNGFEKRVVELLRPFICFGKSEVRGRYISTLLLKWQSRPAGKEYVGEPFYSKLKYAGEIPGRLRTGFVLEKDYGEKAFARGRMPLGDFSSFYVMTSGLRLGKRWEVSDILAGDFTARLGQGLTVWNAASFSSNANVQSSFRRGNAIMPYGSSDENRFFRGGALTVKRDMGRFAELEATAFFSLKKVDAAIKDGVYTSLPQDGLHNTESTLDKRKRLGEMAYGGSLVLKKEKMKVGLNYVGYGYNMHNGRRVQEYNRYQMYDGMHGNFSADWAVLLGKVRTFGELAADYDASMAFVGGAIIRLGGWETSVVYRNYSKGYIAPYAGALSSQGSCSNQNGVSVILQREYGWQKLSGGGEFTYYPWKRYGADTASHTGGIWVKGEFMGRLGSGNLKFYSKWGSSGGAMKFGVKGMYGRKLGNLADLKLRGEFVVADSGNTGMAFSLMLRCSFWRERLQLLFNGAYYNCREWNCRIYMYEYDLPSTYSSSLMYGSGFGWYSMFSCDFGKNCRVYVKADSESEIKIGLKVRFF